MKEPLPIRVPPGAAIANFLYEALTPAELNQDLVTVELQNGITIEVDWVPENDPGGAFATRVMRGFEEKHASQLRDPHEVARLVERLAEQFNRDPVRVESDQNRGPGSV
jgi:hypothetical protein